MRRHQDPNLSTRRPARDDPRRPAIDPDIHAPPAGDAFRLRSFPTDDSAEWLAPRDLALASALLRCFPEELRSVVEIGVWKGAWSLGLLENVPGSRITGVDPYPSPGGAAIRAVLEGRVAAADLGERFHLASSLEEAAERTDDRGASLIHVDGMHTEAAASRDLAWSSGQLARGGVIVVDDFRHPWFPGVGAAMHRFLIEESFRIVLVTDQKAYICREADHPDWYTRLEELLTEQDGLTWARHFREGDPSLGYVQVPDVLGRPVLLALGRADVLPSGHPVPGRQRGDSPRRPRDLVRHALATLIGRR